MLNGEFNIFGGWTSMNPTCFAVNRRGFHEFWSILIHSHVWNDAKAMNQFHFMRLASCVHSPICGVAIAPPRISRNQPSGGTISQGDTKSSMALTRLTMVYGRDIMRYLHAFWKICPYPVPTGKIASKLGKTYQYTFIYLCLVHLHEMEHQIHK